MSTKYLTWEQYSSLFSDVDEMSFPKLEARAALKIDIYTHMRAEAFNTTYDETTAASFGKTTYRALQMTACELVNLMQRQDSSAVGTGLASVSNDGYSESYKVTTQAEKEKEILSCIRNGLAGTGLAGAL